MEPGRLEIIAERGWRYLWWGTCGAALFSCLRVGLSSLSLIPGAWVNVLSEDAYAAGVLLVGVAVGAVLAPFLRTPAPSLRNLLIFCLIALAAFFAFFVRSYVYVLEPIPPLD